MTPALTLLRGFELLLLLPSPSSCCCGVPSEEERWYVLLSSVVVSAPVAAAAAEAVREPPRVPDALLRCRLGAVFGATVVVALEAREMCESVGDGGALLLALVPTAVEAKLTESLNVVLPVDGRPSDPAPKLPK